MAAAAVESEVSTFAALAAAGSHHALSGDKQLLSTLHEVSNVLLAKSKVRSAAGALLL